MNFLEDTNQYCTLAAIVEDPVAKDRESDAIVTTSRRGLSRIVFVAAETAARFEREGINHDPVAWMMAPRRIFDGSAAIDACLERQHFLRAVILHGLSWGLDAWPGEIDPLIGDDVDEDFENDSIEKVTAQFDVPGRRGRLMMVGSDDASLSVPHYRAPVRPAGRRKKRELLARERTYRKAAKRTKPSEARW